MRSLGDVLSDFLEKRDGNLHTRLTLLWEHWEMVLGQELAPLTTPLGHRKDVLLIAAEDSMAAQDIAMQADEVLLRVNTFMGSTYFTRIQVELVMGRMDLSQNTTEVRPRPPEYAVPKPEQLGSLKDVLDPESPVTKCYEAYLRYFSKTL